MGKKAQVAPLGVIVLLFLCCESAIGQIAMASTADLLRNQLDLQVHAWEQVVQESEGAFVQQLSSQTQHLSDLFRSTKENIQHQSAAFVQNAQTMQDQMREWVASHSTAFGQCLGRSGLSDDQRKHFQGLVVSRFGIAPGATTERVQQLVQLAKTIPAIELLSQQFRDRPDLALKAIDLMNHTRIGNLLLKNYRAWVGVSSSAHTQELLQLEGSVLNMGGGLNSLADSVGQVSNSMPDSNSLSTPEVMNTLSSLPNSASGQGGSSNAVSDTANGLVSDTVSSVQQQASMAMMSSQQQAESLQVSSGYLLTYASSAPTSIGPLFTASNPSSVSDMMPSLLQTQEGISGSQVSSAPSSTVSTDLSSSSGGQASMYEAGISGADSGSGGMLSSSAALQGTSGASSQDEGGAANTGAAAATAKSGCCTALIVVIVVLAVGCAGEYYIKNMHKYSGEKYEAHLVETINAEVEQLTEYLKLHPERVEEVSKVLDEAGGVSSLAKSTDNIAKLPLDLPTIIASASGGTGKPQKSREEQLQDSGTGRSRAQNVFDGTKKGGKDTDAKAKSSQSPQDAIGQALVIFYMAYNAVPASVSRQFGFYVLCILLAVLIASLAGGIN